MMMQGQGAARPDLSSSEPSKYDRRRLTYANTFDNAWKANAIRALEWLTGKITIIKMLRQFQANAPHEARTFWADALEVMQIDLLTPQAQLDRIPKDGPVIIVANHPHGLVDGMVISDLISKSRVDYKVLTRSILTGIDEIAASFLIPVPFPHEEDAQQKGIEMRAAAMKQLADGGVVALFPSGVVAASETMMGPVVEGEWNVFTAKMIRRSGATVVPVFFPGSNSRKYQIANRLSATLRQGLLLHEIVAACKKPQAPVIGNPIPPEEMADLMGEPRALMAWLRKRTLALRDNPDA
ncbi:lysophospholipid acyltransferase family protein [Candidatus Rhodobacter oscarellae]|nr:lysophospholipid acyltransferase family protein [Candidatus Rhodobacter lobularis]